MKRFKSFLWESSARCQSGGISSANLALGKWGSEVEPPREHQPDWRRLTIGLQKIFGPDREDPEYQVPFPL
jgi:hypothetical protein